MILKRFLLFDWRPSHEADISRNGAAIRAVMLNINLQMPEMNNVTAFSMPQPQSQSLYSRDGPEVPHTRGTHSTLAVCLSADQAEDAF